MPTLVVKHKNCRYNFLKKYSSYFKNKPGQGLTDLLLYKLWRLESILDFSFKERKFILFYIEKIMCLNEGTLFFPQIWKETKGDLFH